MDDLNTAERNPGMPMAANEDILYQWAVAAGVIAKTEQLTPQLKSFVLAAIEHCASVGDQYPDPDSDGSAGDEIRALYGAV